jgi:hypothetical protein
VIGRRGNEETQRGRSEESGDIKFSKEIMLLGVGKKK